MKDVDNSVTGRTIASHPFLVLYYKLYVLRSAY